MHVLLFIVGISFAEQKMEHDFRIAESASVIGGTFAIVGAVSYRRAKKFEDQMLREKNNYTYNELLQSYRGHRNQYIVAVPASIIFSGLAVVLYTRRNIQKSNFFQADPQPQSNSTEVPPNQIDPIEFDSDNETIQKKSNPKQSSGKQSLQGYKRIFRFFKEEELSQELQNVPKENEQSSKKEISSEKLDQDKELKNKQENEEPQQEKEQEK